MASSGISSTVRRIMAPIAHRLRLMVSRGVVELVNDSLKCQGLQVSLLSDEVQDDVERFQEYGFTSVPLTGAEALFLSVGANRSHGIVACVTDRRWRPKDLNAGDVCLFIATANGERVYLDKTNDMVNLGAKAAADFVALAASVATELTRIKDDLDAHKAVFDAHMHVYSPGPLAPAPTAAPAVPFAGGSSPASVAATKVKAT